MEMADITIKIKEEYLNRFLESFNWISNQDNLSYDGNFKQLNFTINKKIENDTNLQFCQKALTELLINLVKTHELNIDYARYKEDVKKIKKPTQNVPDNIL